MEYTKPGRVRVWNNYHLLYINSINVVINISSYFEISVISRRNKFKQRVVISCGRRVERGTRAPPARRRACSESARGLTIVSFRIVTKFDDRDHPPLTRAGSSRSEGRQGVGAALCVPSAWLCNSKKLIYLLT